MKLYILTSIVAIVLSCGIMCADNNKTHIKVGIVKENAPYTSISQEGELQGFSIDIFNAIKKHLDIETEVQFATMGEIQEKLLTEDLDLSLYMARSKKNYERFYLSVPYFRPERDIITRSDVQFSKLEDFKNKKIIVKRGTYTHESLPSLGIYPENIIAVETVKEGLDLLSKGGAACLITTSDKARHMIHNMGYSDLKVQDSNIGPIDICFASHSRKLISDINDAMTKIIVSGEYDAIYHNWFHKVDRSSINRYLALIILLLTIVVGIISLLTYIFRRRAVRTNKENYYLNKYLADALSVGEMSVWIFDVDTRVIGKIYGKQTVQSDVLFDDYCKIIHPDDIDDLLQLELQIISGTTKTRTIVSRLKIKGVWRSYRITMDLIIDRSNGSRQLIGVSKDCTDEVAELQKKEVVIRSLDMAIALGKLLRWNYNIETGITKIIDEEGSEHIFKHISEMGIYKGDEHRFAKFIHQIIAETAPNNKFEMRVFSQRISRICHYRIVAELERDNGKPIAVSGVWLNTTDEYHALRELQEYHDKMFLAVEAANLMAWSYDISDATFSVIHGKSIFGEGKTELPREAYLELVHEEDVDAFIYTLQDIMAGREIKGVVEYRLRTGNEWRWKRSVFMPIWIKDEVVSVTGVLTDITLEMELAERAHNQMNMMQAEYDYMSAILNSVSVPIHIKDPITGIYSFANAASKEAYGVMVGMKIDDVLGNCDIPSNKTIEMELIKSEDTYEADENIVLANGKVLETRVIKKCIDCAGVPQILIVRTDETENNKALRASQILSASLPALKAFSWYYDSRSGIMYTHHNMKLERGLDKQMTLDEMINCVHVDDKSSYINMFLNLSRHVEEQKTLQYRADLEVIGDYEWWECCAAVDRRYDGEREYTVVCGLTININDNKKAELEMMRLKSKSDLILRNTNSGLVFIDNDYKVQWTNANSVLAHFNQGLSSIGETCYKNHGFDKPCADCNLSEVIRTQEPYVENCIKRNSRMFDVLKTPILQDNDVCGVLYRIDDRTEHYAMIDELRKAKEKAEESDRLKSAFLANISHEIRTPLNAIVGFSDLIVNSSDGEDRELYGQIILNNNQLLLQLIDDILDLSKIEAGLFKFDNEYLDINKIFCEAYSTFSLRKPVEVVLKCAMPVEGLRVFLDRKRFTQVLNNFLSNAVKYTAQGEITFGYKVQNERLYVYVKDTGIGIAEENKKKVFQRFQKFDDFAQGTGLGLAICKAIADNDPNSVIGFESEFGKGSTFWFEVGCEMTCTHQFV